MNRIVILLAVLALYSCKRDAKTEPELTSGNETTTEVQQTVNGGSGSAHDDNQDLNTDADSPHTKLVMTAEQFILDKPTVIVVALNSSQINDLKKEIGEGSFYTLADDNMLYHDAVTSRMDSLKIEIKYTQKNVVYINKGEQRQVIVKETDFPLYAYFYFDGKNVTRTDAFKLMDKK
ncbi:hypothetical protein GN157_06625 [Flavobacterium rakeshii]|uniref:Uncharacterized protein n=1 Tax=Flavobacterium rakeshii TaxID=1038845 RepID=A0A6N8HAB2_9FLAO|nr:hypothetical protein [Flavobacterium rakeshii]MUV03381.1 hypothetical protein [Flavobacterium rakeshii]